jgi:hypothetical protein
LTPRHGPCESGRAEWRNPLGTGRALPVRKALQAKRIRPGSLPWAGDCLRPSSSALLSRHAAPVRPEIRHLPSGTTRIRANKYEPQQLDVHGEDDVLAWLRMSLPTPTLDVGVLHDLQQGVSAAAIDGS